MVNGYWLFASPQRNFVRRLHKIVDTEIMAALPRYLQECTRELLGARGYMRTLNDERGLARLRLIADVIEKTALEPSTVHAIFSRVAAKKEGLDGVLRELESPEKAMVVKRPAEAAVASASSLPSRRPTPAAPSLPARAVSPPARSMSTPAMADPSRDELRRIHAEIEQSRVHARELEVLVRALVERSVLDATRIRGLESVVMAMANAAGAGSAAEQCYGEATVEFLERKTRMLR